MSHRLIALAAIVAVSAVAAPIVVSAAGTPAPVVTAIAARAPAATEASPERVADRQTATCGRKVRVVYPGYAPAEPAECTTIH